MSVYGGAWIQGLCYVVKSANSRGKSFSSLLLPLILHQVLGYLHHRHHTCITVTSCVNRGADMRVPFDEYSMKEWLICKHNPFPFNEIFSNVNEIQNPLLKPREVQITNTNQIVRNPNTYGLICKHNPFPFNEIFSNVKLSVPFNEFLLR